MTEITAIITTTLIVAAIVATIIVTLREVLSDGAGHPGDHGTPRSHVPDPFDPRAHRLA